MKALKIKTENLFESDLRFDASYYLSGGRLTVTKLKFCSYKVSTLGKETDSIFKGNIYKRYYVANAEKGYQFMTPSDMMKSNINGNKYVSKKYTDTANLLLEDNWILVSRSGTLGKVVFTNKDFKGVLGTDDLIRIIPNNKNVLGGYLYAYLSSKYGYALLTQSSYGGVVKHIEPHHIKDLPVPILPKPKQQEIHKLITEAADLRVEANRLLEDAKRKIAGSLGLENSKKILFGSSDIKSVFNNYQKRLDSPTYINSGIDLINQLKKKEHEFFTLRDFKVKVTRPGIFKRVKVTSDSGLPYIKGSELNKLNPFKTCEYLSKTRTPFLDELYLRDGQILFTCAGTIGNIKLISKEFEERKAVGSQDIIRIESKDKVLVSNYLYAYLKLDFVKEYIQSLKYGSVIERVEPFHVEMIPVYLPQPEVVRQIVSLIDTYKMNNYTAFKKEELAISLIEKEIESWQK